VCVCVCAYAQIDIFPLATTSIKYIYNFGVKKYTNIKSLSKHFLTLYVEFEDYLMHMSKARI